MKNYFLFFIVIFIHIFATAQTRVNCEWLVNPKTYLNGGIFIGEDVASGKDESLVVVGSFGNNVDFDPGPDTFNLDAHDGSDIYVAKYSKEGKLLFAYNFGNAFFQGASAVTLDDDDNIYVTGGFTHTIDFDPGRGTANLSCGKSSDIFILSLTKKGIFRFARDIGHPQSGKTYQECKSIILDNQRNIYLSGSLKGVNIDFDPSSAKAFLSSKGKRDVFFAKYDSLGNYLFAKSVGGSDEDESNSLSLDREGNIIICGEFKSSSIDFDPGSDTADLHTHGENDIFFAKYDTLGNYVFAKSMGGIKDDIAEAVETDEENNIIISGELESKEVDFDLGKKEHLLNNGAFLAKYDRNANYIFAFSIQNSSAFDVSADTNNNIIVIGKVTYGTPDFDPGDGIYHINMSTINYYYIAKYTAEGDLNFAEGIGNYAVDRPYASVRSLEINKQGQIVISGNSQDTLDVDPGAGVENIYAPAITMFVAKYNNDGGYNSAFIAGNYHHYYQETMTVASSKIDVNNNVYICGYFIGKFDFDNDKTVYALESVSDYNGTPFFAKYDQNGKLIFARALTGGQADIYNLAIDKDENLYITGDANTKIDFDPTDEVKHLDKNDTTSGNIGYFFAKYNVVGNLVFVKGELNDRYFDSYFDDIAIDKNKNIYLTGRLYKSLDFDPGNKEKILSALGRHDIFIAKYDSSGNYIYANTIGSQTADEEMIHIVLNKKADITIAGSFSGHNLDFDPGPRTYFISFKGSSGQAGFVAGYNTDGSFKFAFSLQASDGNSVLYLKSLAVDKYDNLYIAGDYNRNVDFDGSSDSVTLSDPAGMFFASYDKNGLFRLVKGLTSYQRKYYTDNIEHISVDSQENIFIAGEFFSYKIDCDPGSDSALLINTNYDFSDFATALFFSKYDSLGNYIYAYGFNTKGVSSSNFSTAINVDRIGNICYAGYAGGKIDFDPGPDSIILRPTALAQNLFLVKYSQVQNSPQSDSLFANNINSTPPKLSLHPNEAAPVNANEKWIRTFMGNVHQNKKQ